MNLARMTHRSADASQGSIQRFRQEMEDLFDRVFREPWTGGWREAGISPRIDLTESDEEVTLRAELPGVKPEDIDIQVLGDTLTLRGEKRECRDEKGANYQYCESEYGSFSRTIQLPTNVDQENVDAQFDQGVLTVRLRKTAESKPRKIAIRGSGGDGTVAGASGRSQAQSPAQTQITAPSVRTISRDELSSKLSRGERVQVVNVLEPDSYHLGFIKGSKKIPVSQIDRRANELDKNVEVVTYCAGPKCHASRQGAEKLARLGFNVRAFEGGIEEWKQAGLPTE